MENERSHLAPKLRRAEQLQGEVDSLSRELQILGELYQQQREETQDLVRHSQREQELMVLCASMKKEKEASQKVIASLTQQLRVGMARGKELEVVIARKEEEIASLQQKLVSAQGKHQAKMKVSGEKERGREGREREEEGRGGGEGVTLKCLMYNYCKWFCTLGGRLCMVGCECIEPIHKRLHVSLTFWLKHKLSLTTTYTHSHTYRLYRTSTHPL